MSDDSDFDRDDEFDPTDESDPTIRELRLEVVRLEARLDQLLAAEAERVADMIELRGQIDELRVSMDDLAARMKRHPRRMVAIGLTSALIGTVLAQVVVYLLGW